MSLPSEAIYSPEEVRRAYTALFLGPRGDVVLEDLKRAHFFYGSTAGNVGTIDPMRMAMAEGERNVILRILAILQTKETDYVTRTDAHR